MAPDFSEVGFGPRMCPEFCSESPSSLARKWGVGVGELHRATPLHASFQLGPISGLVSFSAWSPLAPGGG